MNKNLTSQYLVIFIFFMLILAGLASATLFIDLHTRPVSSKIIKGTPLRQEVTLKNHDIGPLSGIIYINITSIDSGRHILLVKEPFNVTTAFTRVYEISLPPSIKQGDYQVKVNAVYTNRYGEEEIVGPVSSIIKVYKPVSYYTLFGIKSIYYFYGLCAIAALLIAYAIYNHQQEKKKRYVQQVNLALLPHESESSAYLGKVAELEYKAYLYLQDLKTHTIVAGATGGGKTVAAQVIVEEALMKGVSVIVFDPTAQWTGFLRKCKERSMLKHYGKYSMKKSDARAFNGNVHTITDPRELIKLQDFIKPGEITVFTIHHLDPKQIDILVASTIRQVFHANLPESQDLRLLIVYDEVHRLLPKFGGSGAGFLQIERACREFRKWGVGLVLISQVLSDFVGEIKANISTEIQMRTRDESDLKRIRLKYGDEIATSIIKAPAGQGMLENPQYNKGLPYFIAFRPLMHSITRLSDEELEKYNKYNEMINDLSYQLEQLEKLKVDVFDLRLELKLALDKLKTGNFNMVDIYLEGVIPRIKSEWQKLGKTPLKRQKELISMEEINESIEQAKKARLEYLSKKNARAS